MRRFSLQWEAMAGLPLSTNNRRMHLRNAAGRQRGREGEEGGRKKRREVLGGREETGRREEREEAEEGGREGVERQNLCGQM